ncbi:hypothetical protein LEMLEM_LOCUS5927 [Lemmus lemmus]
MSLYTLQGFRRHWVPSRSTPGKDAAPDGSFGVAREDSHVAPAEGSAPEPAALIGPRLPGSGRHLNVVQTKRARSSHAGNSRAAGPACWPHEHKHHPAAPAHVGLAQHKRCPLLPASRSSHLSAGGASTFSFLGFGSSAAAMTALAPVWLYRAFRPSARWLRPLDSSPPSAEPRPLNSAQSVTLV